MHAKDPLDLLLFSGLDLGQPFLSRTAEQRGISRLHLSRMVAQGLLVRPIRGVLHSCHLEDSLDLRIACLRLVIPPGAVVTDRTAGWLLGVPMVLAPGDHLQVPLVSAFGPPGNRLRNGVTASGERRLAGRDVISLGGLRVTTPLRTACDLGRLLHRDAAFAALDALLRLGAFSHDALLGEVGRFRGYRGVRQLRAFAPHADPGSESFGESVLRLRWYDAGVGVRPETQIEVVSGDSGRHARLDLGDRESRFAVEYDGEAFHGPDREAHDQHRRTWLAEEGWDVEVFRREHVFGRSQDALERIIRGYRKASLRRRTA